MFGHPDRPHARATAAMRNAKRFVQIQMANIRAVITRTTEPNLGVHVGAIEINLAAVRVHDLANLADGWLKDAVRARIRDHERG